MTLVAPPRNKPTAPQQDARGTYRKACAVLARDLGWRLGEVYELWRFIAMAREFEQRWPRACAEWRAMHDVVDSLCKAGAVGS